MSKEKILTIDDLPMHKDTYFFGYGINIDKPYEMANQIIKLKKENQELKQLIKENTVLVEDEKGNYQELNINPLKMKQENEELKKQLHEASIEIQHLIEQDIDCPSNCNKLEELKEQLEASRRVSKHHLNRELDLEKQQKEFIEWLERKVKKNTPNLRVNVFDEYGNRIAQYINAEVYEIPPEDVVKEVLSKYKEIIGVKDE